MNNEIAQYVKDRLNAGLSEHEILQEMIRHGWNEDQAEQSIDYYFNEHETKQSLQSKFPMDFGVMLALILLLIVIVIIVIIVINFFTEFGDSLNTLS